MPPSRRSPALIGAFALLVLVTGAIGLLLVSLFKSERRSSVDAGSVATTPTEEPTEEPREGAKGAAQPLLEPPAARGAPPRDAGGDVPVWARTPGVWTTPYPEGGKINPPLPPVKLLPEMVGAPDRSGDAGAAADGPSP